MTVRQRRWLVVAAFIIVQALIWLLLELFYYNSRPITDTSIYYNYSSRIMNGYMPYDDFSAEYPPVAMLIFLLPRLFSGSSYNLFVYWFELEMFLFSCGNILLISFIAWRRWGDIGKLATALGLYTLFNAIIGFIIAARFDVVAALIILAVVAASISDRKLTAWILVGVGIMTKVVPLFIAPLLLVAHYRRRQKDWLFIGPVVAVVAASVIALPFLFASSEGLARAFLYHAERPLQIESSWSTPILIMNFFGYGVRMFASYGSHNLFTPLSNFFATVSGPVTVIFMCLGYWFFWKRISRREIAGDEGYFSDQMVRYSALTVVIFIAGGKVLSPQFLIWLLPLMPLIYDRDRNYVLTIFGAILFMTQLEFPFFYGELLGLNPAMVILVALRNVMLIWLAITLIRKPVPRDGIFGMYKVAET
jgi:uncharacterized membrane protein